MKFFLILLFSIYSIGLHAQRITENKFIEASQTRIITSEAIVTENRLDTINNIAMRLPINVVMSTSYIKNASGEGISLILAVSGSRMCIEKGEIWIALEDNTMLIFRQDLYNSGYFTHARAALGNTWELQMIRLKTLATIPIKRITLNTCDSFIGSI